LPVCLPLKTDVLAIFIEKYRFLVFINHDKTNIRNENSTDKRKQNLVNVRNDRENELEFGIGFKKAEQ
jgi:hypothetical protein